MKKGDSVLYVPYSMGRMPFIWGSDALEFNPERFLKDGVFHSVSPFKFTAFQVLNLILLITINVNDFHFRETCEHRVQCVRLWIREGRSNCQCTVRIISQSTSPSVSFTEGLKFIFMLLQAGPRICLGRDSAYLQLMVTVALIVHFFTFQLVPGQEITYTATLVMPMKNGVTVSISPRQ